MKKTIWKFPIALVELTFFKKIGVLFIVILGCTVVSTIAVYNSITPTLPWIKLLLSFFLLYVGFVIMILLGFLLIATVYAVIKLILQNSHEENNKN